VKETEVEAVIVRAFQSLDQFCRAVRMLSIFPLFSNWRAYQRIVRVSRWLWHQDMRAAFDEVVAADVCHDLGSWQNLRMELFLDGVELLQMHC
jgi:hypothetical protein